MNKAIIIGNLTKDPELKTTPQGVSVCTFTVAVNRNFGEKKEVDYIPIVTWRALADNCAKFLAKGRKVGVSGRIQVRSYEDQKDQYRKKYVTEVVAEDVEFLSPKDGGTGNAQRTYDAPPPQYDDEPDASGLFGDNDGFEPLDDEQMPF